MELIKDLQIKFDTYLVSNKLSRNPINLYEPADYILSLGGKRLRPVFTLLGSVLFGGKSEKALDAAMAVEVFHNFTLIHDDIMDQAEVRRGYPTVHLKYNTNTAILSGDVMMIQAYQYLLCYDDPVLVKDMLQVFNKMAAEVCEGQQMDMDFETLEMVTIGDYLEMITKKTSVLMGASFRLGAMIAGAGIQDQVHIYEFAKNFGIAFQLQDDVLDTFGDGSQVGKKIGGDIVQNKKTYLYLKAMELSDNSQQDTLIQLYSSKNIGFNPENKIEQVTQIFESVNVREYTSQLIEAYKDLAISHLMACNVDENIKQQLIGFINEMIYRDH